MREGGGGGGCWSVSIGGDDAGTHGGDFAVSDILLLIAASNAPVDHIRIPDVVSTK